MTTYVIAEHLVQTRQRVRDYLELTKPRLTALVLVTAAAGFWLGLDSAEQRSAFWPMLIGIALTAAGGHALNQWSERAQDARMVRTQRRPLPSGRMSPEEARRFGWLLSVGGVVCLAAAVNLLAATLAALTVAIYVLIYTPLKLKTPFCTFVGAITGALPPMIGWAGAQRALDPGAWILFGVLYAWQVPHFLAIAVLYREDYAAAGFRMLPDLERTGSSTARQIVLYALALLPLSLLPTVIGLASAWYLAGAFVLGLAFLGFSVRAAVVRSMASMRRLFHVSVIYLPLLLGLLALDKLLTR